MTERSASTPQPLPDAVQQHLEAVCAAAGLQAMLGVYEIIRDRGTVGDARLRALTSDDVAADYESIVGPAIDRVELCLTDDQ